MLQITSQSHCPFLATSHPCRSSHRCLTIMITSSGATCLCQPPPREWSAKVTQLCCNNTVPVVRPFAAGIARRPVKHVSRRGPDEGGTKTKRRGLCGPKSVIENQKRAGAWELIWRSPDDGSGISKYRRWNAWLRENTGESTSGVTSARTHRAVERSSRRAPVTVRAIKTPTRKLSLPDVVGGRGRSIVPTVRSSQSTGKGVQRGGEGTEETPNGGQPFTSVFAAFVNGLTTEAPGSTGLEEVEMASLHEFREKLTSALDTGRFLEMWNIRETHPKGRPVRTLVRYRMCAPDPALQEDAQNITKLAHILRKVLMHRMGIEKEDPAPPTNNERKIQSQLEQRRKKMEANTLRGRN